MPDQKTIDIYRAYVQNVRDFAAAAQNIRRVINRALKEKQHDTVNIQTKFYALVYSIYSEAIFMKLIFTPYGFSQDHLDQILAKSNIKNKWIKTLELAFYYYTKNRKGSDVPNKKLEIKRIIDSYIINPSVLRNKIAHGQWANAMNSNNTKVNSELSNQLNNIDSVTVYRWFRINNYLVNIIQELIDSPDRAHHNNYHSHLEELKTFIVKTSNWSISSKMQTPSMRKKIKKNTVQ